MISIDMPFVYENKNIRHSNPGMSDILKKYAVIQIKMPAS